MGSRKALAVAAYLSGHYWHPDELGVAIDAAMGTPAGAANDPRNVITLRGRGLEPRGLVTLDRQSDGRRQTWSCKLTAKGKAAVAAYCTQQGIENPVAAAPEQQAKGIDSDIEEIRSRDDLQSTQREALIQARRGQGQFRQGLLNYWGGCAVVGCTVQSVLRSSHIKPWSKSSDTERLDAANGLLLTANLDALFDDGLITFDDDGQMLVSTQLTETDRSILRLKGRLRRKPTARQQTYLKFHREFHRENQFR
jgi:hypothetical protein